MRPYINILIAGYIWIAQAFCSADDATLFINAKLPTGRQKDMRITQSYSPGCALPGHPEDVYNGQLTTVWFRVTQLELDAGTIVTYYVDGDK